MAACRMGEKLENEDLFVDERLGDAWAQLSIGKRLENRAMSRVRLVIMLMELYVVSNINKWIFFLSFLSF